MTITEYRQSQLSAARRWLEITAKPDPDDEAGQAFELFCRVYIRHLQTLQGVNSFRDDLDHCQLIKDALRSTYSVHEDLAQLKQQSGCPESPFEVSSGIGELVTFMAATSLEITATIRNIEQNHPELAPYFASERKMFADWLTGEGVLAGTQWEFDHDKVYDHSNTK